MFGFGKIGPMELVLILGIALVIFGPEKLPEFGKSMGQAIRQFRNTSQDITDEITKTIDDKNEMVENKKTS